MKSFVYTNWPNALKEFRARTIETRREKLVFTPLVPFVSMSFGGFECQRIELLQGFQSLRPYVWIRIMQGDLVPFLVER